MNDKDRVKKYLSNISNTEICVNCSMSRHMHEKYPKNACEQFKGSGMTSYDGEARKDGWKK